MDRPWKAGDGGGYPREYRACHGPSIIDHDNHRLSWPAAYFLLYLNTHLPAASAAGAYNGWSTCQNKRNSLYHGLSDLQ